MKIKDIEWRDYTRREGWTAYSAHVEGITNHIGVIQYSPKENKWWNFNHTFVTGMDASIHNGDKEAKKEFTKILDLTTK